ncbi:MAG: hypothetical protein BVN34_03460 [Proteobacteria bacterium ST_bin12]|nr:MAG: hypothetical protein BVN34_03460 [Proteobacteria bacterium ST_bin12]
MTMNPLNLDSNMQQDNEFNEMQAKQIGSLLNTHSDYLSMRTLKQLENSRELAVKAHTQYQTGVAVNRDGTISYLFSWAEHHRLASTGLLIGAIFAGFVLMQSLNQQSENGDAFLLGAELPPEAFVDRGFEPRLNNTHAKL